MSMKGPILALAGGVGGAKLALGLARVLAPQDLTVVVNTGDDEVFHGLHVSPDLDTVMYTLAGMASPNSGWGLLGETFNALKMLKRYGAATWFNLGDGDLATHIERTRLLQQGWSLSEVTQHLCRQLGVSATLVPMSDQPVRTIIETEEGELPFQEYFVMRRCEPRIRGVRFQGAQEARMSPTFELALHSAQAVVFCPSNPIVSIGPIMSIRGVCDALRAFHGPRIAVSPIVGEQAIRGPAAKMLRELGEEASCVGVSRRLLGICDVLVLDSQDANRAGDVQAVGLEPVMLETIMETDLDKERVARGVLQIVQERV